MNDFVVKSRPCPAAITQVSSLRSDRRVRWLNFLLPAILLLFPAVRASADILHYIPITDSRYAPNLLVDLFGPDPLNEWTTYTGDDTESYHDNPLIYGVTSGIGTVEEVFDYPLFQQYQNPSTTAFFELEINTLDDSGLQSMRVGMTDLSNSVKWDEAAGKISGTKNGLSGDDVTGIARWSDLGNYPLRLQVYYNYNDFIITYVLINDDAHTSTSVSWQGSVNPFSNFYGQVEGTDPNNLEIFPFVLCDAQCEVQMLNWRVENCLTTNGAVDVSSCGVANLAITDNDGQPTYTPGGSLTYVLAAINFGPTDVTGATVNDAFPAGLTCAWSCYESGGASCPASGSGDIAASVDLPVGAIANFFATCSIDSGLTDPLVNVASISPPDGSVDPSPGNNTATDTDINVNDLIFDDGFESGVTANAPAAKP